MPKANPTTDELNRGDQGAPPSPKRINVAVSQETLSAIDHLVQKEQVSLTEAVRRLIAYGDLVYRAVKDDGDSVVFKDDDGHEREVILI